MAEDPAGRLSEQVPSMPAEGYAGIADVPEAEVFRHGIGPAIVKAVAAQDA